MTAEVREQLEGLQGPLLRGMIQHLNYLKRVENTLAGQDDFAGTLHTECALGKMMTFYHQLIPLILPEDLALRWLLLDKMHQQFHMSSKRALETKDNAAVDDMEMQSLKIVEILGSLENNVLDILKA